MAAKLLVLILAAAAVSAEECRCNQVMDTAEIWEYLTKLEKNMASQDKENDYVLPAVLSPLVECDCSEKIRPKRKIMPDVIDRKDEDFVTPGFEKGIGSIGSIRFGDRRCPKNYARFRNMCVREEDLLD